MEVKKLKRAVIKEELVAITGDFINSIILNQFIYWSDRVNDFDKMVEEERKISSKEGIELNQPLKRGWIYKKAEELSNETMIGLSDSNMRRRIKDLVSKGYLFERKNPKYKWDQTKQYRVNFTKISKDLKERGYVLSGYRFTEEITAKNDSNSHNNAFSKIEIQNSEIEIQNSEIEKHTRDYIQRLPSEITTSYEEKIEKEKPEVSKKANHKKEEPEKNAPTSQEIVDAYNETCVSLPRVAKITDKRKKALKKISSKFSIGDIRTVFKKAQESSFLNGSTDKWSGATFDWLVKEDNIVKVLEGNYDDKNAKRKNRPHRSYNLDEFQNYSIFDDE